MDRKKFAKRLLFPPFWLMVILTTVSAAALITVFANGWEHTPAAYIIYALSFYTLSVVTLFCALVLPGRFRQLRKAVYDHPLGRRYLTDDNFRTALSLNVSLGINLLYVLSHLLCWYINRSWWFIVLAVYYGVMSAMWLLLAAHIRRKKNGLCRIDAWKCSRSCAYTLLSVNLTLSGAVLMILYQNRGFEYPGVLIYVMALYTFYTTADAIVGVVKHRKDDDPIEETAKIVRLSAALVSMLNLETAMFAQFGAQMSADGQHLMIILTGAGISIVVIILSALLSIKATKQIRSFRNGTKK